MDVRFGLRPAAPHACGMPCTAAPSRRSADRDFFARGGRRTKSTAAFDESATLSPGPQTPFTYYDTVHLADGMAYRLMEAYTYLVTQGHTHKQGP